MKIFRVIVTRLNGSRFSLTTEDVSPEAAAADIAALCGRWPTIHVRNIEVLEHTDRGWVQKL